MEFVDIAGLVKGASKGEGLGNKFLANIREVDAIVHVIRCFRDDDVIHVSGSVDPSRDIEIINLELALSDLNQIEKRRTRLKKQISTIKEAKLEDDVLEKLCEALENENAVRSVSLTDEEKKLIKPGKLPLSAAIVNSVMSLFDELSCESLKLIPPTLKTESAIRPINFFFLKFFQIIL